MPVWQGVVAYRFGGEHMPSLSVRALSLLFRLTRKRTMVTTERARKRIAAPKADPTPPSVIIGERRVSRRAVDGFDVYTVLPAGDREPERAVLYLHGGAYVSSITPWHWRLITRMADRGLRVEVPLYGLAPKYTHREAFPFLGRVHRELCAEVPAERTAFVGDSAGGGLALALAQAAPDLGLSLPVRMVLIAPCVEVTMTNPGIAEVEPHDPWLASAGLLECARSWAGGDPLHDPRLSPLHGPMEGLPPTDVFVGTHDLLMPDLRLLRDRLVAEGVPMNLVEEPGAFHVYPLVPCPEGRRARDQILDLLGRL